MNSANHEKLDSSVRMHTSFNVMRRGPNHVERSKRMKTISEIYRSLQNIPAKSKKMMQTEGIILRTSKVAEQKMKTQRLNNEIKSEPKFSSRAKTAAKNESIRPKRTVDSRQTNKETIYFDLAKASSDLLELKRDLASYEFEFIDKINIKKLQTQLNENFQSLRQRYTEFSEASNNKNLFDQIVNLTRHTKLTPSSSIPKVAMTEDLHVRPKIQKHETKVFKGFVNVSGTVLLCKATALSFYSHSIQFISPNGSSGKITVEKKFLDEKNSNYSKFLLNEVFPYCYAYYFKDEFGMIFDPLHSVEFQSATLNIKGIGQVVMKIVPNQACLYLEIVKCKLELLVDYAKLEGFSLVKRKIQELDKVEVKKLVNVLKKELVFYKRKLKFASEENFFSEKEKFSDFVNDEILKLVFHNYMKKKTKFIIRVQGRKVKVVIFDATLIIVSIKKRKKVSLEPKELKFLNDLQDFSIINNPATLSGSLELGLLIKKIFSL